MVTAPLSGLFVGSYFRVDSLQTYHFFSVVSLILMRWGISGRIFTNTHSLWLCLCDHTSSLLSGTRTGSTAVYGAITFRPLLYGKQAWETARGLWDPAMLERLHIKSRARTGGELLALHDLPDLPSCLSHGMAGGLLPAPPLRGKASSSLQHDENERRIE